MTSLRPYQRAAIDALYSYFSGSTGNPLVIMPTGTGKSVVIAEFCREAVAAYPETRILILTHVKELIDQNNKALVRLWPEAPAGIYSAGLSRRDIGAQVLFAGIQSIHKHAAKVQRCDLVLIDEAHLLGRSDSGQYRRFLADVARINQGLTKIVGFTATPYRLDSGLLHKGKNRLFTDIAFNYPILEAMRDGYLCPVVPKETETQLDVTGVGTRGGEFIAGALEAAVDQEAITRAAVAEIVRYGEGRGSWLVFCAGVNHAKHVRDEIRSHGVRAETVNADTPAPERAAILEAFKAGALRCITNANVLTTGFDAPGTDLVALLRPTQSVGLYVQMVGRGTRLAPGKDDCLILDFAGNTRRHGPIDTVNGDKSPGEGKGEAPVKACEQCGTLQHAGRRTCVSCGAEFPPPEIDLSGKASTAAVLSTQQTPAWRAVSQTRYDPHKKLGKPTSLRVSYLCGITWFSEWICLEHTGYPRSRAEAWWKRRSTDAIPATVEDALLSIKRHSIRDPAAIQVRPVGQYHEITAYQWADD